MALGDGPEVEAQNHDLIRNGVVSPDRTPTSPAVAGTGGSLDR